MEKAKAPETVNTDEKSKKPHEDRIVMLSDGVFAIAMTLLALDIRLPEGLSYLNGVHLNGVQLDEVVAGALGDLVPKFIGYIISFFVIAIYWLSHRRITGYLTHIDRAF